LSSGKYLDEILFNFVAPWTMMPVYVLALAEIIIHASCVAYMLSVVNNCLDVTKNFELGET